MTIEFEMTDGVNTLQSAKKTANVTEFLENQLEDIELYLSTLYRLKFLS